MCPSLCNVSVVLPAILRLEGDHDEDCPAIPNDLDKADGKGTISGKAERDKDEGCRGAEHRLG